MTRFIVKVNVELIAEDAKDAMDKVERSLMAGNWMAPQGYVSHFVPSSCKRVD